MADEEGLPGYPIFKGASRPAMIYGVPLKPFIFTVVAGLVGSTLNDNLIGDVLIIGAIWPVLKILKFLVHNDDQRFRLIGLWMFMRMNNPNAPFWGSSSYAPTFIGRTKRPATRRKRARAS